MYLEKQILIAKGTIKHIPGVRKLLRPLRLGGSTIESRYCYTVWMRHLRTWALFRRYIPSTVAELGPGDSLGTGLAALLSGAEQLWALDVIKYWDNSRNLRIFDELTTMFMRREAIPDQSAYPRVKPLLDRYDFPAEILTDEVLKESLNPERLDAIRAELEDIDNPRNRFIKYKIPWHNSENIKPGSTDFIYSQATLECIEDLDDTFSKMCKWLRNDGLMSHTIDFKSHGLTTEWNGHWMFSEHEWDLVKGRGSFLVNRKPLSAYLSLHKKYGFETIIEKPVRAGAGININEYAEEFRNLSEEDMTTSGLYVLSAKTKSC